MGQLSFIPNQHSTLYADHFTKDCIDVRNKFKRLHKGAIPTIFAHSKENSSSCTNMRLLLSVQPVSSSAIHATETPLMEHSNRTHNLGMNKLKNLILSILKNNGR